MAWLIEELMVMLLFAHLSPYHILPCPSPSHIWNPWLLSVVFDSIGK
jgi:hypothetical protein